MLEKSFFFRKKKKKKLKYFCGKIKKKCTEWTKGVKILAFKDIIFCFTFTSGEFLSNFSAYTLLFCTICSKFSKKKRIFFKKIWFKSTKKFNFGKWNFKNFQNWFFCGNTQTTNFFWIVFQNVEQILKFWGNER